MPEATVKEGTALRTRRLLGGALATAMLFGPALWTTTTAAATGDAIPPPKDTAKSVTLVTGDRVTIADGSRMSIERAPGRGSVSFLSRRVGGHLHVIPADAAVLLNAGHLDPRLFDVTGLLAAGYGDSSADLPLILAGTAGATTASVTAATVPARSAAGVTTTRELPAVNGMAVGLRRNRAASFWTALTGRGAAGARALRDGAVNVWLDGLRQPSLDVSVPQIGAPDAWQAGYTGSGVSVAVLDTGVDGTHPDLAGRISGTANFTAGYEDDRDLVGHGTHVAATVAGSGAGSNGRYKGVAPDARLLVGKVCALLGCRESWILAGMQWAAADQHARVVNMSLGGSDAAGVDLLEQAVNTLSAQYGTLFVVAAGNAGADRTVNSPASAEAALAVGAVSATDALANFSSRGPRVGDSALKPDLTAPGVGITAARGKDATLVPGEPSDLYVAQSGTSMASPHVAGAAAILGQQHPDWTGQHLKSVLMAAAKPAPGIGAYAQGAGRVDIARAIRQTVTTQPASVSFGQQQWPHSDDPVRTQTVTYHNAGSAPITLNLTVTAIGPDGNPPAAGTFTVDQPSITVPAGGTGAVVVTADTRAAGPDGPIGGRLTATAGDLAVQTPIAVDREAEAYDLTISYVDRAGHPASNYSGFLAGIDIDVVPDVYDPDGTVTVRVPTGHYLLSAFLPNGADDPSAGAELVHPDVTVDRAMVLVMDARLGRPIDVTVPDSDAVARHLDIGFVMRRSDGSFISADVLADGLERQYTAQLGGAQSVPAFTSLISTELVHVNPDGSTHNSPFAYHLAWYVRDGMPTGLTRHLTQPDLATVHAHYAQTSPDTRGSNATISNFPAVSWDFHWYDVKLTSDLPFVRNEYFNTDGGVQWEPSMTEDVAGDPYPTVIITQSSLPVTYQRGRTYEENWNKGVFGPAFPDRRVPELWMTRSADRIFAWPDWYGDASGIRDGDGVYDHRRITLYRDEVKVGETTDGALPADFAVPSARGRYRLELVAERSAPIALSTKTTTAWTFESEHVDGNSPLALPLSAIRFAPALSMRNDAPAGHTFDVPVRIQPQPGSTARSVRDLRVDVSYDDGATWTAVTLRRTATGGVAVLWHPAGRGFVSLRATATDTSGNAVEQQTIRAYRYTDTP